MLGSIFNKSSKYNKFVVAAFGAAIVIAQQLGYQDIAGYIAAAGSALGVILVGNGTGA